MPAGGLHGPVPQQARPGAPLVSALACRCPHPTPPLHPSPLPHPTRPSHLRRSHHVRMGYGCTVRLCHGVHLFVLDGFTFLRGMLWLLCGASPETFALHGSKMWDGMPLFVCSSLNPCAAPVSPVSPYPLSLAGGATQGRSPSPAGTLVATRPTPTALASTTTSPRCTRVLAHTGAAPLAALPPSRAPVPSRCTCSPPGTMPGWRCSTLQRKLLQPLLLLAQLHALGRSQARV